MIKKLQYKFIALSMCSMVMVLVLLIGSINISNYLHINETLNARLDILAENNGHFPDNIPNDTRKNVTGNNSISQPLQKPDSIQPSSKPDGTQSENILSQDHRVHPAISQEAPFDTRYFTVKLADDGSVLSTDTGKIAAISDEDAALYAQALFENGKHSGYQGHYKYRSVSVTDDSGTVSSLYIFLDCERELNSFHSFLTASIFMSCLGLLLVFILVVLFSKKMVKPVAESYKKQKRFITDASHEIKTPLTIIDANTEALEMENGENEWTRSTRKQIKRLASLTEKLVFLSRMDEESNTLTMVNFSLSDAVLDTAQPFEAVALSKNKKLILDIRDDIFLNGDEGSIRQLVSLLLDNAMKYSSDNSTIKMTLKADRKNKILTLENEADGLTAGNYDILFERFYRLDDSRNSSTGGYGIGLSVAQAIVLAHKGKISARSDNGKTILFTIIL